MVYNCNVDTRSLYIHWPFCPYRCTFCPFVALASHNHFMGQYHDALLKEITLFAQSGDSKRQLETIFFGGGTPSTYPDDLLLDMSAKLKETFEIYDDAEVSIEVNPGTVSEQQLAFWKEIGINRLSIGVQSLDDAVLKKLNRLQTARDVKNVLGFAARFFENISVDLIVGLPGTTKADWKKLLNEVITWPLKHISIYFLTLHNNTQLYFQVQQKNVALPCDDAVVDSYHWSVEFLKKHGFNQYETSNFSKPGYECKHNLVYWERKPYKGFGLGACSFDGTTRFENQKNLTQYLQHVENGQDCSAKCEVLTEQQVKLEKIMLGLRRSSGVSVAFLCEKSSQEKKRRFQETIEMLKESGHVQQEGDNLVLTPLGFVLQNDIAVKLSL